MCTEYAVLCKVVRRRGRERRRGGKWIRKEEVQKGVAKTQFWFRMRKVRGAKLEEWDGGCGRKCEESVASDCSRLP